MLAVVITHHETFHERCQLDTEPTKSVLLVFLFKRDKKKAETLENRFKLRGEYLRVFVLPEQAQFQWIHVLSGIVYVR